MAAPDPALVERFRKDVAALADISARPNAPIALAVSGGPDSMAMLTLASAAFPGRVIAATVDHRLRPESANEAAMVAAHCGTLGLIHAILTPDTPIDRTNVQANARAARYRLLQRWAVASGSYVLATAHHADDQAETFLMRAARGSGVSGLAGIRSRQDVDVHFRVPSAAVYEADVFALAIIRPLLAWRVRDLRRLVAMLGIPFVDDPSNADSAYDRTRFRALLADNDLLDADQIARSARHAADADDTLRAIEAWLWQSRQHHPVNAATPDEEWWLDIADLPRELRRRMARTAIDRVRDRCGITRPEFSPASNVEPLLDALEAGRAATQAGVMAAPMPGGLWRFYQAPPRRSP